MVSVIAGAFMWHRKVAELSITDLWGGGTSLTCLGPDTSSLLACGEREYELLRIHCKTSCLQLDKSVARDGHADNYPCKKFTDLNYIVYKPNQPTVEV